jgi:hypothetical protein
LASTVIVYGTTREAGTNRYAAEELQARFRERNQQDVPIQKDFEVNEGVLADKNVIFVGRPEDNSALAAWAKNIGLDYEDAVFKLGGTTYGSESNALIYTAKNPLNEKYMVLVYAGNSPLETARAIKATGEKPAIVLSDGKASN